MMRSLLLLFVLLLAPHAAWAQADRGPHVAVSLVAGPVEPGRTTLAIVMKPNPGWHSYWKNPGDAGIETQADWMLPSGARAGQIQYPVPTTLIVGGLMNYVYEGEHALLVELTLPPGLAAGARVPVKVKLDYLVCTKEICVPESGSFATDLTVGSTGPADFGKWRAALPRPLDRPATFAAANGVFRLEVPLPAAAQASTPYFFPLTHGALAYAAPQTVARDGDRLVVETKMGDGGAPKRIEGLLRLGPDQGLQLTALPGPVAPAAPPAGLFARILLALGGAILGGLILNVMPCVFPIVSLKALSLARAGGDERAARREALAYAAGVIATCLALGAIILGARAAGSTLGWAFQLQNPWIVLALLLLATAITLNLAGLFEIPGFGGGQGLVNKGGAQGAFWTGVLAAFVATPCTGPFMAAALGAALVLPIPAALAVFAGLGLGLALPFLAVGYIPALRRRLPRPGPWMARFQRILAVPMALTVVALLWVVDRSQGAQAFQWAVITVLLMTIAAVASGRRPTRVTGAFLAAILVLGVISIKLPTGGSALAATPFTEAALASARATGKPVFVYFTADWCLTCKVNENTAINSNATQSAFAAKGVQIIEGDWTDGDPVITRVLQSHGAFGVPLYLYYAPGSAEPKILPQVLTPTILASLST